jgi:hypothetical protein
MKRLAVSLSEPPASAGGIQRLLPPASAGGSDFFDSCNSQSKLAAEAVDFIRVFERFVFANHAIFRLQ